MMDLHAATQYAIDMRDKGETTTPNVEVVRMMGVRIIRSTLPKQVRDELRAAVKAGRLGHLKKEGLRPEAFYHPNSWAIALERRDAEARQSISAISGIMAKAEDVYGPHGHHNLEA
jgi:hypothetical protein